MPSAVSLELWYAALGSPFGIIVQTSDPEKAKQRLYHLRKEAGDQDLYELSIVTSPTAPTSELWIVKRKSDETQSPL